MGSNSKNGASNAFGMGPSSGHTLNFNFIVLNIIFFISIMIWLDAQDHIVAICHALTFVIMIILFIQFMNLW